MERIWLKHYPPGVPHDVDLSQYSSLVDLIDHGFHEHASRNAYAYMDRFFTFGEIDRYSAAFASWLQSQGLARGARVAIMMPNVVQYPIALAGVLRAGYVVVNVNPLYTPRELEHQLKDSGAEAIVILENFAATLQQVIARTAVKKVIIASLGEMLGFPKSAIVNFAVRRLKKMVPGYSLPGHVKFTETLDAGARRKLEPVAVTQRDIAFLQYTGGTTGVSKGAALTHGNLVANVLQMEAWIVPALQDTSRGPVPTQFVYICALPLYHVFALVVNCLFGMRIGTLNVLIPNPRDIAGFVKELGKYKFNVLPGVNTLYNALLENEDFRKLDFSSLRVANGGGMAVQKATSEKWLALTGVPIIEGYGLSETSPVATCNPILNREYNGTIGLPFPNTEIQILDDAGQVRAARPAGRDRDSRPAGDGGLLEPSGRDREGDDPRRVLQVGRHRHHGRARLHQDRGPQEGHDPGVGLQRVPERNRAGDHDASRRRGVRRGRRARRAIRRGRQGVRRAQGSRAHRRAADGVLQGELHRLQEAEVHRVPRRAAEEQRRQDPAARTAGRGGCRCSGAQRLSEGLGDGG